MGPGNDNANHRSQILPMARLRGPSRPRASQEHIRSLQGTHPDTRHWLPTREHALLQHMDPDVVPKNLLIRISATKINSRAPSWWPWTSTVSTTTKTCPAPDQGGKCRSCRLCWSRDISNVTYAKH